MGFALTIFRVITFFVFISSFLGKVRNIKSFEDTISVFGFSSHWAKKTFAYLVILAELIVAVTMFFKGEVLLWGFVFAFMLLMVFTFAVTIMLIRKINTPCNCFGESKDPVSKYDVIRNFGFILCALTGSYLSNMPFENKDIISSLLAGTIAITFTVIWINLKTIIKFITE